MNDLDRKTFRKFMYTALTTTTTITFLTNCIPIIAASSNTDSQIKEEFLIENNDEYDIVINCDNISTPSDIIESKVIILSENNDIVTETEINIDDIYIENLSEEIIEEEIVEEIYISEEEKWTSILYEETSYKKYVNVNSVLNVRIEPVTGRDNIIGGLYYGDEVEVVGVNTYYQEWACIKYNDKEAYVHSKYLVDESEINLSRARSRSTMETSWTGEKLNKVNGKIKGPSGNETYYNLSMKKVVYYMNQLGYDYEVWVREDGVKMFGDYVMVAANLKTRPKGTLVETSLGTGIVVDTGAFVNWDPTGLDIAVAWK